MLNFFNPGISTRVYKDPLYPFVSQLLHFEGADSSQSFFDNCVIGPRNATPNGVTDPRLSTSNSKFGNASGYFDGTSDWITLQSGEYMKAEGDFTIEFWFYPISWSNRSFILSGPGQSFVIYRNGTGNRLSIWDTVANRDFLTPIPAINTWHYLVFERSGSGTNNCKAYLNGVLQTQWTQTSTTLFNCSGAMLGGYTGEKSFDGFIDEFRFTNGVARYGGTTPPMQTKTSPNQGPQTTSLTFVASATSNTANITIPASAQPGDIAFLADCATNTSGSITNVNIPGWSASGDTVTTTISRSKMYYNGNLQVGDPGSTITTLNGNSRNSKCMIVLRPNRPVTNRLVLNTPKMQANTAKLTDQTAFMTGSGGKCPSIMLAFVGSSTGSSADFDTISPAPFTGTVRSNGAGNLLLGYILNPPSGTQTFGMPDLGTNHMYSSAYLFA